MALQTKYISVAARDTAAQEHELLHDTYDEAVLQVHENFLDCDFEVRNGKPYDPGHEDEKDKKAPYKCFQDIKMYKGMVAEYTHSYPDGPIGYIKKIKYGKPKSNKDTIFNRARRKT